MVPAKQQMIEDLKLAFRGIGMEITSDDVETVLRIGVDKYLSNVNYQPSEESMTSFYIILNEMRKC